MTALDVTNLNVALAGRHILHDVSVRVGRGELVGLIGPNGAGKTTLMRAIMGLIPMLSGTIRVAGSAPTGYVPQRQEIDWSYPMSVEQLVATAFIGPGRRRSRRDALGATYRALRKVGMYDYAERTISDMSGGQKQRVLVARALATDSDLLLLDEPFTGLDHPNQDALSGLFVNLARTEGVAILMSTHDLTQAVDISDSIVMLNRSVRATGAPQTLMNPQLWMDTYQVRRDSALLRSLGMGER